MMKLICLPLGSWTNRVLRLRVGMDIPVPCLMCRRTSLPEPIAGQWKTINNNNNNKKKWTHSAELTVLVMLRRQRDAGTAKGPL